MKIKKICAVLLLTATLASCVAKGPDGRRVLVINLPPDPIRDWVVEHVINKDKTLPQIQLAQQHEEPPSCHQDKAVEVTTKREVLKDGSSVFKVWVKGRQGPDVFDGKDYDHFLSDCQKFGVKVTEI